ncbi:2-amino-4-hydroxy-6-hydroxymethyldihydropteridine diphosphokinase [Virgibacillus phasianinus]|uniref:2-amino-4-hydroxy-6-hydroxymethyldihydropteridine diphosphokinase n=1 Tax=Virgibacillus phasianinus TaxID=2017483 RepID=A0A220U193_9BACI|nr:2-amino-4-hydroxy-6-hydroxymethyldihydropteridine diphosphokinase [Virgibacillus phasianinus]ASK61686.1 2-amino-4-hydroxy-6-hydroxymethyldihydropteridine diphosphokinase [Virgibacillus phasianinus]
MNNVFLALGTNIEPRYTHLQKALHELRTNEHITIKSESSIYETAPVGYTDQADFLNMAIQIETPLTPFALLERCQRIEEGLGRKRAIRFGPRTIDLDILIYNDENIKTERLNVPHPRLYERAFVLIPLKELNPELPIGAQGKCVSDYVDDLTDQDVKDVRKWTPQESAGE